MSQNCLLLLASGLLFLAPDSPDQEAKHHYEKAQELTKSQKFEEAVASLKKAVELAPRNDIFLATLSDAEFKVGKYADGVEHALAAIKINDKVGAYYTL